MENADDSRQFSCDARVRPPKRATHTDFQNTLRTFAVPHRTPVGLCRLKDGRLRTHAPAAIILRLRTKLGLLEHKILIDERNMELDVATWALCTHPMLCLHPMPTDKTTSGSTIVAETFTLERLNQIRSYSVISFAHCSSVKKMDGNNPNVPIGSITLNLSAYLDQHRRLLLKVGICRRNRTLQANLNASPGLAQRRIRIP